MRIQCPFITRYLFTQESCKVLPNLGFALQPSHPINARQRALFQRSSASITPAPLLHCLCCGNPLHPAHQLLHPSCVHRRRPSPLSFYSRCPSGSRLSQQLLPPSIPCILLHFCRGVANRASKLRAKTCQRTLPHFRCPGHRAAHGWERHKIPLGKPS